MKFQVDDLVKKGLVSCKTYPEKGLKLFKYKNKVFYDNLWHLDDRLLECRGIVTDLDDNVVIHPFTKLMNYKIEYKEPIDLDTIVVAIQKMNGFMASAIEYKDELLVATTGTLDSEFAKLAKTKIKAINPELGWYYSYIFEICDAELDPHIIKEIDGVYLIGIRDLKYNRMLSEEDLDEMAELLGFKRPVWTSLKLRDLEIALKDCKHEGYVVRDYETNEHLFKMKSPHYLSKKFLMRLSTEKILKMYEDKKNIKKMLADEEFYDIVDYIVHHIPCDTWINYTDQQRRTWIEEFFKREY